MIWRLTMNSLTTTTTRATTPMNNLAQQLHQVGLRALPHASGRFFGSRHAGALVAPPTTGTYGSGGSRGTLPPQPGTAAARIRHQEVQTYGRFRLDLANQDRTRHRGARSHPGVPAGSPQPDLARQKRGGEDDDREEYLSHSGVGRLLGVVSHRSRATG